MLKLPQSFPALGSFQISQLFARGGQSIGVLASASVLPVNTQDWSPLGWTYWISLRVTYIIYKHDIPPYYSTSKYFRIFCFKINFHQVNLLYCTEMYFVVVQLEVISHSLWPHGLQHARFPCPSPSPKVAKVHVHWISDAIQPSHPLSSPSPIFNLSQHQGLFKWVSSSIRQPKYWSFRFSISPSNEYLGLLSFRMNWLDLLAVQGTLKSLLQHHSSKPQFFSTQPSL